MSTSRIMSLFEWAFIVFICMGLFCSCYELFIILKSENQRSDSAKYLFDGKADEGVYIIHHKGREYLVNTAGGICPVGNIDE